MDPLAAPSAEDQAAADAFAAETHAAPPEPAPEAQPSAAEMTPSAPAEPASPEPHPATQPPQGYVPYEALKDTREDNRALKAEIAALKAAQAPRPEPVQRPNVLDDPEGYERSVDERIEQMALNNRMEISGNFALRSYGQDRLEAAKAWGLTQRDVDPTFGARFLTQADPFGWLVGQHQQADTLTRLGGKSIDDYFADYAKEHGFVKLDGAMQPPPAAGTPTAPAAPPPPPPAPTRSLAAQPSAAPATATVYRSQEEAFEAAFKPR